jgi:phage-related minor tail protein
MAIGESFVDINAGAESAKEAFKTMGVAMLRTLGEVMLGLAAKNLILVLGGDLSKLPALAMSTAGAAAAYVGAGAVQALGDGGIVTRPTLALVGERGPEAVVPLSRGNMGGTVININAGTLLHERQLEQMVASIARRVS